MYQLETIMLLLYRHKVKLTFPSQVRNQCDETYSHNMVTDVNQLLICHNFVIDCDKTQIPFESSQYCVEKATHL